MKNNSVRNGKKQTPSAATVFSRNDFYKDGEPLVFRALIKMAIIAAISVLFFAYSLLKNDTVVYVGIKPDNTIIDIKPLSDPNMSDAAVSNWAIQALVDIFNYSHFDWSERLDISTSRHMTPAAKENFISTLKKSGILKAVIDKNMYSSVVARETPIILNKGRIGNDVFAWQFRIPVTITYRNVRGSSTSQSVIVATITRDNQINYKNGVAIAALSMAEDSLAK